MVQFCCDSGSINKLFCKFLILAGSQQKDFRRMELLDDLDIRSLTWTAKFCIPYKCDVKCSGAKQR